MTRTYPELSSRPPNEYIPPVQEPYTYIIFRASEVKDLAVDEPVSQRRNVHDDPAVIGVSPFIRLAAVHNFRLLDETIDGCNEQYSNIRERIKTCEYPVAFLLTFYLCCGDASSAYGR